MPEPSARPRVVVVGAGFGGLQCARKLAGRTVDVLLLDRQNYHLFTPLLYQVASSLLNPSDIAMPVRAVIHGWQNVRFRLADVTGVDLEVRVVRTKDGAEIPWDWLVLAAGSRTNFFGLDSVERAAVGLKDLPDAIVIRNQVLSCFESAQWMDEAAARAPLTTFVVAGGGPTGVEYAGALSELLRLALRRDFPELDLAEARVVLVEAGERILGDFPPDLAAYATGELERRGIEVRTGVAVTGADERRVELSDGSAIDSRTLIWAAGVLPGELAGALPVPRSAGGRIEVGPDLRIPGSERAFAIGDIAAVEQNGAVLPMVAPPAMQEGRHAAANILRAVAGQPMRPFRYHDKGLMATIGRNAGITVKGRVRLKGFMGWAAWLVIHLYYLIGFRNRMAVLFGWVWDYLRFDRPIRIIARGKRPPPEAAPEDRPGY